MLIHHLIISHYCSRWARVAFCALLYSLSSISFASDTSNQNLHKIQSAYIYNVLKFTQWPSMLLSAEDDIQLCIIGEDDVSLVLQQKLQHRKVQQHNINIQTLSFDEVLSQHAIQPIHVLYISQNTLNAEQINALQQLNILLIGSYNSFLDDGGVVSVIFEEDQNRISLNVNLTALQEQSLSLSSQLLKIAVIRH